MTSRRLCSHASARARANNEHEGEMCVRASPRLRVSCGFLGYLFGFRWVLLFCLWFGFVFVPSLSAAGDIYMVSGRALRAWEKSWRTGDGRAHLVAKRCGMHSVKDGGGIEL